MALKADSGPAYNWNQGRPYADATDAAALGPAPLGPTPSCLGRLFHFRQILLALAKSVK